MHYNVGPDIAEGANMSILHLKLIDTPAAFSLHAWSYLGEIMRYFRTESVLNMSHEVILYSGDILE